MPDPAHLLAFCLAALLLALMPGPAMLYVLARTLGGGRSVGLRSTVGTGIGGCMHVAAAAAGLSAVLAASATAFTIVKYAGAAYLIGLGIVTLLSARRPPPAVGGGATDARALSQGVLTEALNPKTALFFVTFLPQFCQPENGPLALQVLVLGVISVAFNTLADVVIAFAAGPFGRRLAESAKWWRRQRQATGTLLIGLGVYAATAERR